MFCCWNKSQITQCLVSHRKHVKRRLIDVYETKRNFSSGKYLKLGNLYARLGLTGDVSQSDIKHAYYKLSKEHHPDRNEGCNISAEKFRSITEAYEILGNVTTRAHYDRETPYGAMAKRARYRPQPQQPSSAFTEKDEEFAQKIRTYRENMRRKARNTGDTEDFTFRRENVFDFDAWYRAHFHDDFETKMRYEHKIKYAKQYEEQQLKRMAHGFWIRTPKRFFDHREFTDIEKQTMKMEEMEAKNEMNTILAIIGICVMSLIMVTYIVGNIADSNFKEIYTIQNKKTSTKTDER